MSFFVTADGGLTTAGYVGCVVLMVALVVIARFSLLRRAKESRWMPESWLSVQWVLRWRL